jgi:hypothetical protein
MAQYPVGRTTVSRSVVNRLADESAIRVPDPDARAVEWELRFHALSDAEREVLESFFRAAGGPLHSFTFLDPANNLLRWSEDLSQDVWVADGLLQVADGRLVNAAQIPQGIEQRVNSPGAYHYCFSALVESGAGRLSLHSADGWVASEAGTGRLWCSGSIPGEAEEIRCRIEVAPGAVAEVSELLLQAQPMPGSYRATAAASGVHTQTRFVDERLQFTAEGPDLHSTTVRLISRSLKQ